MQPKLAMVIYREFERGWGNKVDGATLADSEAEARIIANECNAKNTSPTAPDYYVQAEVITNTSTMLKYADHLSEDNKSRLAKYITAELISR